MIYLLSYHYIQAMLLTSLVRGIQPETRSGSANKYGLFARNKLIYLFEHSSL